MRLFSKIVIIAIAMPAFVAASAQSCPAPVLAMFNICTPFHETSVTNPVQVLASATTPQGTLTSLQLWVDGTKYMNSTTHTLSGPLPVTLSSGKHRFTFVMINSGG